LITQQFLNRKQASEFLCSRGTPTATATLAKLACIGGGPAFQYFGRFPRYTIEALEAWIAGKLTPARKSTSDRGNRVVSQQGEPVSDIRED
jgi:hypothetical protein